MSEKRLWYTTADGKRICAECGSPEGCTHTLKCSRVSEEDRLRSQIRTLESQVKRWQDAAKRSRTSIAEWHGRYMIVKTENNRLRAELWSRKASQKQDG